MPYVEFQLKKILFVHIPKTGGTAMENWMRTLGALIGWNEHGQPKVLRCPPQHFTYDDLSHIYPKAYFDYSFCIVRNPYDRLASEYRYQNVLHKASGVKTTFPLFDPWVAKLPDLHRIDAWALDNHLRPQHEFVSKDMRCFKYEDGLDTIVATVAADNGVAAPESPLPRAFDFSAHGTKVIWTRNAIEIVKHMYSEDFEVFNYDISDMPSVADNPLP